MQNTPKNFFLQVGIIVTLYASIVSFLTFIFGVIDILLPEAQTFYYSYANETVRTSVSVLLVMFPLFIWLSRMFRKSVQAEVSLAESALRKWLLYFTLFLAGLTIAIDVIVLVRTFLDGENIALAFILKVLAVLVVASAVFYFYLRDIRGEWNRNPKKAKMIAIIVSIIVALSIIGSFFLIGSPTKQRDISYDRERVMHLQTIQYQILSFYQAKGVLPQTIEETNDELSGNVAPRDPETGESYGYEITGDLKFKICATFKTDSGEDAQQESSVMRPMIAGGEYFMHGVGTECFERTIDKDRYPVNKPVRQ